MYKGLRVAEKSPEERMADYTAGALLMPLEEVYSILDNNHFLTASPKQRIKLMKKLCRRYGVDMVVAIRWARQVYKLKEYFQLPSYGSLYLEHVFYAHGDDPILFVCKDNKEQRYLCSCYRMSEKWVVCQVSEDTLLALMDEMLTIWEAFEFSHLRFVVTWDGDKYDVQAEGCAECLPKAGEYLGLDKSHIWAYRDRII